MQRHHLILLLIFVGFLLLAIPATGLIYHQDEYSWIMQFDGTDHSKPIHPPLYLFLGKTVGSVIGFDNLRWLTVPFAIANVILVYAIAYALSERRSVGLAAAGLFAFNAYSILGATMIDIDGALLPFFVLLAYYAYLRKWWWLLALALIGGFFAKLSFIIFLGALIADVLSRRLSRKTLPWIGGGAILVVGLYFLASHFLPDVVTYAQHYNIFNFATRSYADLGYKLLKSFVFLGPLLMLGIFSSLREPEYFSRYRFWWLYLLFSFLFYVVIFDFATYTIERYFLFMIAPMVIIAAESLMNMMRKIRTIPVLVALLVIATLFVPHDVIPLFPKTGFVDRILSPSWNFLIPIMGGSGPVGFYVSALFVGLSWLLMAYALLWRKGTLFVLLGVGYTIVILQEFLFGGIYGSANRVAWDTVNYINANPEITRVNTYYDIAPYDLRVSGKYENRFYVTPKRDYTKSLEKYRLHYMIVHFPEIAPDDKHLALIKRCPVIQEFRDKRVYSEVYDCTKLP
ncbi:MAG: hypothetical protein AAB420_03880 [Patescibacteria group bacterium]